MPTQQNPTGTILFMVAGVVDAVNNQIVNVVGLPTSSEQVERRYAIAVLKPILERIVKLQTRLSELREQWPV